MSGGAGADAGLTMVPAVAAREPWDGLDSAASGPVQLVLDLDGYEGPIDVLLSLAREQKVDLCRISILQLADQYLDYVRHARLERLEPAADYLVMAAWLAYLKSRLLLPESDDEDDGPSGEELAAALAFRLRRLEAMRDASRALMARDQLGRDVFARGEPQGLELVVRPVYEIALNDLISAYADQRRRRTTGPALRIAPMRLMSLEAALDRLSRMLGLAVEWTTLERFLPSDPGDPLLVRAALASTFAASLELAREGRLELRQSGAFEPIFLRRAEEGNQR